MSKFDGISFRGIPVTFSENAVIQNTRTKKWKRLGRPSKCRTRTKLVPAITVLSPPFSNQCIICHPNCKPTLMKLAD